MPQASWRGLLRLSLVSGRSICRRRRHAQNPFACTRWQPAPADVDEDDLSDRGGGQQGSAGSVPRLLVENGGPDGDQSPAATRITLRPHDPRAGEEIEKPEVVKGYESSLWPGAGIIGIDFDIDRLQLLGG